MAKRNRNTLKNFFREGAMPSAQEFADLIDSSLNTLEDGFDKSARDGFKITVLGKHTELLSFFRDNLNEQPVWTISFDERSNALQFKQAGSALLTLTQAQTKTQTKTQAQTKTQTPQQRLGIGTSNPVSTLDVAGVITQQGRQGYQPNGRRQVPADGQWHDISGPLEGCHAFEVMAGTGNKGSGKYALLQATALNAYNPSGWWFNFLNRKKRIKVQQAYYLSRSCKLELRWQCLEQGYCLQLRSRTDLGTNVRLSYYLTRLWFDADMSQCWQDQPDGGGGPGG